MIAPETRFSGLRKPGKRVEIITKFKLHNHTHTYTRRVECLIWLFTLSARSIAIPLLLHRLSFPCLAEWVYKFTMQICFVVFVYFPSCNTFSWYRFDLKSEKKRKKKKERGDVFLCTVHAGVIEWSMKLFFRFLRLFFWEFLLVASCNRSVLLQWVIETIEFIVIGEYFFIVLKKQKLNEFAANKQGLDFIVEKSHFYQHVCVRVCLCDRAENDCGRVQRSTGRRFCK